MRRRFSIDGVSVGAQTSHSAGSPMSQRECAGFNWPPLSIPAEEPVSICPQAVNRAGWSGTSVNACSLSGLPRECSRRPAKNSGDPDALIQSRAAGVAQPVSIAKSFKFDPCRVSPIARVACPPPVLSLACGVGHPVRPVSDVRSTDARRRERNSPEGIRQGFHVSLYKVEPRLCVLACNLLSKDDCRLALADEPMEVWPQVPLVIKPSSRACRAERLARTGTGPNRSIIWPAGATKGIGTKRRRLRRSGIGCKA